MMHISACRASGRAKKAAGKGRGWCRGVGIARGGDHAVLGSRAAPVATKPSLLRAEKVVGGVPPPGFVCTSRQLGMRTAPTSWG